MQRCACVGVVESTPPPDRVGEKEVDMAVFSARGGESASKSGAEKTAESGADSGIHAAGMEGGLRWTATAL